MWQGTQRQCGKQSFFLGTSEFGISAEYLIFFKFYFMSEWENAVHKVSIDIYEAENT